MPIPAILTKNMLRYLATAVLIEKKFLYSTPYIMVFISGIPEPYASLEIKSHIAVAKIEHITLKIKNTQKFGKM